MAAVKAGALGLLVALSLALYGIGRIRKVRASPEAMWLIGNTAVSFMALALAIQSGAVIWNVSILFRLAA